MEQTKSISIKLTTLIKIIIVLVIGVNVFTHINNKADIVVAESGKEVEIAEGNNNIENREIIIEKDVSVSSRSERREESDEVNNIQELEIDEEIIETEDIQDEYISIEEVTISQNMDLTERTGLSKDDFVTLISQVKQDTSGFFEENAETIYDLCEQYELNEIFFCGLISAESGWSIADNHRRTYNYISLMSGGKLIQFESVEDGLEQAAKRLHDNYLTPGGKFYYGTTLSAVKTKFCPASSTWVGLVYGRMQQILK